MSTRGAFAALKADGSVVTWGSLNHGGSGDSLRVTNSHTRGIKAIPEDHSLGMVPVSVHEQLTGGVEHIASTTAANPPS